MVVGGHPHHAAALHWYESLKTGDTAGFCRASQKSFLRLLTRRIAPGYEPISNETAWTFYESLAADPFIFMEPEPPGVESLWRRLSTGKSAAPKLWMDAWLAAFAIAGGCVMVTLDHDFQKFTPDGLNLLQLGG